MPASQPPALEACAKDANPIATMPILAKFVIFFLPRVVILQEYYQSDIIFLHGTKIITNVLRGCAAYYPLSAYTLSFGASLTILWLYAAGTKHLK